MREPYLEELGMLKVLEQIDVGLTQVGPTLRYCLIEHGLVAADDPPRLTERGRQLLQQLRVESQGDA